MKKRKTERKRGRTPTYPWDRWFKARRFRVAKGVAYDCQTHSMAQQIRGAAGRRKIKVSLRIADDTIVVTRRGAA